MLTARRAIVGLWLGVGVQIAGRVLDARWHATHNEFEGTLEQIEAHWLAWLGVVLTLAVAAAARARRLDPPWGYTATLLASLAYVVVAAWHFVEHGTGNDPAVAHVLLVAADVLILAGVIATTVAARHHGLGRSDAQRASG